MVPVVLFALIVVACSQPPVPPPFWAQSFMDPVVDGIEFRSLNGTGNNVLNPLWGTRYVPLVRIQMPAEYYSGPIDPNSPSGPFATGLGEIDPTLPNIRSVSNRIQEAEGGHEPNLILLNQLHVDWGHMVTIDATNTAVDRSPLATVKAPLEPNDIWADANWGDSGPTTVLKLNADGICYKEGGYLALPRTAAFPGTGIAAGLPKEHFGDVSQFLDLSAIYGDPINQQRAVGGYMQPWFTIDPETGELADDGKFAIGKDAGIDAGKFFISNLPGSSKWKTAGDYRFNKTPGLRVISMIFMKEHNRLCDQFKAENPSWSATRIFHEARKWNIAFFQSITFREYLAASTGRPLSPYTGYDPNVDPGIDNFFAGVAFRYGHSGIPPFVPLLDNNLDACPYGALRAADIWVPSLWEIPDAENPFWDPDTQTETERVRTWLDHEAIIRGLSHSLVNKIDLGFVNDIRNTQSQKGGPRHGGDLASIDIFRARDMGIPLYNAARKFLNLTEYTHFENITKNKVVQETLRKLYGTVDRIDTFVGTFAEQHIEGTEMGELAIASIHEQMERLRNGDRFFFENEGIFTPKEVEEIHSTKLRDLILRNFPEIDPNALPVSSFFLNERQLTAFRPDQDFEDPTIYAVCAKGKDEVCREADLKAERERQEAEEATNQTKRALKEDVVELEEDREGYLPWSTIALSDVYQLSWAIDRNADPQEVHFLLQVQTEGWAGIGFAPEARGTMKGADIILCRTWNDQPECRDSKALDVGEPTLDEDIGGSDDLTNVQVKRVDGILTAQFTRPLVAVDSFDTTIEDGTRIIFAFNPVTNALKYHGPTRNPDITIDFESDYKGPPVQIPIDAGVTIFLYVFCGIGSVISVTYMIIVITKSDFFKFQTPEFCLLVLFGSLCGYASVLLLLPEGQSTGTCMAHLWLFGMSFWMVFMGFFVKVARVWWIIYRTNKTMTVTVLAFWKTCIPVALAMLGEAGFNIAWDVAVTPYLDREDFPETNEYMLYCAGDRGMWIGSVVFRACFLAVGVILAFVTRKMPVEFNWSKEIAMSIYTMAIILGIGIPLGFALAGSATMVVMLKGLTITIAYMTVTTIVHFDSLHRIIIGKSAREFTQTTNAMSRASKAGTKTDETTT